LDKAVNNENTDSAFIKEGLQSHLRHQQDIQDVKLEHQHVLLQNHLMTVKKTTIMKEIIKAMMEEMTLPTLLILQILLVILLLRVEI
jgi:hypothetical protein